jgi:site-specific DNA-methyltransferase (adenine-specific)
MTDHQVITGDCLSLLVEMPDESVDLVFCSPPYGNQRRYDSATKLFRDDEHWLAWTSDRFMESLRVSRGLVAFVVEGYTRNGTFHPLPEMLTVELMRRGANIRPRNIYQRFGIMGGSPDEFAQHHEIIVRASKHAGRLPYAAPAAMGHPPKCPPGGAPSHHSLDGRVNRPRLHQQRGCSEVKARRQYNPPVRCKSSNVINCGAVGGGNMGSQFAHSNEAAFPEKLAEFVIASYCPLGGTVLDPFCGSGTTLAVAKRLGRNSIGIDNRESQTKLTQRRLAEQLETK